MWPPGSAGEGRGPPGVFAGAPFWSVCQPRIKRSNPKKSELSSPEELPVMVRGRDRRTPPGTGFPGGTEGPEGPSIEVSEPTTVGTSVKSTQLV